MLLPFLSIGSLLSVLSWSMLLSAKTTSYREPYPINLLCLKLYCLNTSYRKPRYKMLIMLHLENFSWHLDFDIWFKIPSFHGVRNGVRVNKVVLEIKIFPLKQFYVRGQLPNLIWKRGKHFVPYICKTLQILTVKLTTDIVNKPTAVAWSHCPS